MIERLILIFYTSKMTIYKFLFEIRKLAKFLHVLQNDREIPKVFK